MPVSQLHFLFGMTLNLVLIVDPPECDVSIIY